MSYKEVTHDLIKTWFKNYFLSIFSIVFPILISFILTLAYKNSFENATGIGFTTLSMYVMITCGFCLPIFIYQIRNSTRFKQKYGLYINSWKLTYFVAIYAFVYSILLATIGLILWLIIFLITSVANYYSYSLETFQLWIKNIKFANWVEIIFYYGYEAILAISCAFVINAFVKEKWLIYFIPAIIALFNFFFIGTLSFGQFYSKSVSISSLFQGFSYIAIFSYTSINGWIASMGIGAFDFVQNVNFNFGHGVINITHVNVLMNFTIPFILISIAITISSIKFRWWKGINQNAINNQTITKNVSKVTFIINYVWIGLSFTLVIIGIACTIVGNLTFKHDHWIPTNFMDKNNEMVNNDKYILGVFFLVTGIINLSLSAGYFMKNIYSNIQNQLQSHIMNIYESNINN